MKAAVLEKQDGALKLGVEYVNISVSRCLKTELGWTIDKRLWLIINAMLFKIVVPLRI